MTRNEVHRTKRGVAATEFLIVFPTFLIFSLFIVEVSLMWSDRHVLRLAGFEAARALVTEAHLAGTPDSVCWPVNPQHQQDRDRRDRLLSVAKTAAANKIAIIAPTLTFFAGQLPGLGQAASAVDATLSAGQSVTGRYLGAVKRFVLAWPMAYAMTSLKCSEQADMVTVSLEYQRAPRLPYVGSLLWAIKSTQKLNSTTGGIVEIGVNNHDYYGITTDVEIPQALARANAARTELQDTIRIMKNMSWEQISGATSPLNGLVSASLLDPVFNSGGAVDRYLDSALGAVGTARGFINRAGPVATAIVYAVPENLRLIPMKSEVRLSKGLPANGDPNRPWTGRAFLVAPLTTGDDIAWSQWTQKMQEIEGP
jgi:hypothetical protein